MKRRFTIPLTVTLRHKGKEYRHGDEAALRDAYTESEILAQLDAGHILPITYDKPAEQPVADKPPKKAPPKTKAADLPSGGSDTPV